MSRYWLPTVLLGAIGFLAAVVLISFPLKAADPAPVPVTKVGAADHDWPQWRGPNRDGISLDTGLMKKWPDGGPPFLYCMREVGGGYCPPTIVGDRMYITGRFEKNEAYLMAFDLPKPLPKASNVTDASELPVAGKMVWKERFGNSCNGGEHAAPTVVGDQIFVMSGNSDVAAFNTSGKMLWSHNLKQDFKAHIQTNGDYGFNESPLVDGDKVIVCPGTAEACMVASGTFVLTRSVRSCVIAMLP